MKTQRTQRVGEQIRQDLAELLRTEVKDPRVGMVTVTHVEVTADMAHARVHFTSLSGREHGADSIAALTRASGFLRSQLAQRLKLYTVPQLHFIYDESIESGMHVSQLIDAALAEDSKHPKE